MRNYCLNKEGIVTPFLPQVKGSVGLYELIL